jgi:probable F420-dependent oxidoreductase
VEEGVMEIGVVLPTTELGASRESLRAYGRGVEALGYRHVLAYDHVLGADPAVHQGWSGPYDVDVEFHEPMVVFGFLSGVTALGLVSGIVILPQRQTALVAKQAAEVDLLCGGEFRLGVGIGWNRVEYEALGERFAARGRRIEAQVALLRRLWTERSVSSSDEFDTVTGAGLAPMPRQRPIPIWFGATTPAAYERAGRLGDGWFPLVQPGPKLDEALAHVRAGAGAAGRDPRSIGMQGRVDWRGDLDNAVAQVDKWQQAGATHLGINTMGRGLGSVDEHLTVLGELAERIL